MKYIHYIVIMAVNAIVVLKGFSTQIFLDKIKKEYSNLVIYVL